MPHGADSSPWCRKVVPQACTVPDAEEKELFWILKKCFTCTVPFPHSTRVSFSLSPPQFADGVPHRPGRGQRPRQRRHTGRTSQRSTFGGGEPADVKVSSIFQKSFIDIWGCPCDNAITHASVICSHHQRFREESCGHPCDSAITTRPCCYWTRMRHRSRRTGWRRRVLPTCSSAYQLKTCRPVGG